MSVSKKLLKHLNSIELDCELVDHKKVYTAYDAAATLHIKLGQIAKSLLIKFNRPFEDGTKPYAIAIVAADKNIDLKKLAKEVSKWAIKLNNKLRLSKPKCVSGKKNPVKNKPLIDIYNKISKVSLPKEKMIKEKLKISPGSVSAFGSVYKLPVFVDLSLKGKVIFSSGFSSQSVKMAVGDFIRLEQAMKGNFSAVRKRQKKDKIKKG